MEQIGKSWRENLDQASIAQLGALWGKSDAGGRMNLLLQHLFDAMAVAELIWDHHLSAGIRARIDAASEGRGRDFLIWLCGLHDVGKATPAFQSQSPQYAASVRSAGLTWPSMSRDAPRRWRHDVAGARILLKNLNECWASESVHQDWVWPLIAGHHGSFPGASSLRFHDPVTEHGDVTWGAIQNLIVGIVTTSVGFRDLLAAQPVHRLTRSDQLLISGLMIMCDWIASAAGAGRFVGVDQLEEVGPEAARDRAWSAWRSLGLKPGWVDLKVPEADQFSERFDREPRPFQELIVELAHALPTPGLLVLEAPMGEGKTEAALAAAEILAARFGADGVFVGMPTQATSDPMFSRVLEWSRLIDPSVQVALLHGKRMFNKEWQSLLARRSATDLAPVDDGDQFGLPNDYGMDFSNIDEGGANPGSNAAPAEWYLGRKRGLLAPVVVGTIDQLLYAATRTKHVMLRYAGLAGKVVILDEVHAADVYMSQFLSEALRWLGQGGVPVIMLSATLAPDQRRQLVSSYLAGAAGKVRFVANDLPEADGYPSATSAWVSDGLPQYEVKVSGLWRESQPTRVEILEEEPSDDSASLLAKLVHGEMSGGGCVLVIRNTVRRAQDTYVALEPLLGDDVRLLHSRFGAAERADSTQWVLERLGPPDGRFARPKRLVVVATQVAEQSFDVDVDLLVSDLAPIDLLLQRAGRLHRHNRPRRDRPEHLGSPRMIVTGLALSAHSRPWFAPGSEEIYGRLHLLRTAALVRLAVAKGGWSIPQDVPSLVAQVYDDLPFVPGAWEDDESAARAHWEKTEQDRKDKAQPFLLTRKGHYSQTSLEGLHRHSGPEPDEEVGRAVVRDGDPSLEVLLLHKDARGYRSLSGRWLGTNGEVINSRDGSEDPLTDLLGGTVRMPAGGASLEAQELTTLPEWKDHPWLKYAHVVCLDEAGWTELPSFTVAYDRTLGLQLNRKGST